MDHVFSVTRNVASSNHPSFLEWLRETKPICSVSSRNIVAFTSSTNLRETNPKLWKINVYVSDLNVPYEPHRVTSHHEDITLIEWDSTGSQLLIGDCMGNVEVWALKDHILSEWTQVTSHAAFPGESVLKALWFHPGIKFSVSPDKKYDILPYQEKFPMVKFGASVRAFGGRPAVGCLALSCTGLICALVIQPDGTALIGNGILEPSRFKIKAVDLCYNDDGTFFIVMNNGSSSSCINCHKIGVEINSFCNQEKSSCTITCKPSSSFYLNTDIDVRNYPLITDLKFVLKEAAQAVVVATAGSSGSTVQLWELVELPIELHTMFRKEKKPKLDVKKESEDSKSEAIETDDSEEIAEVRYGTFWQHHASSVYVSPVSSIGTPRLSLFDSPSPPSYIVVAYDDGSIKCFIRENLKEICKLDHPLMANKQVEGQAKFGQKLQSSLPDSNIAKICDLQFTWTGSALVALDTFSQIFVYKLSQITDPFSANISPQYAQLILEYCLVTGIDSWDILLGLKSHSIEPTCELLTSAFNRQSQALQTKHYTRFHKLKGFLYLALPAKSSSSSGQVKAGDAYTTIMLHSVSTFLKSLLRARDNQEKEGPAENLSAIILTKATEFHVDKVLVELEHKEFFVEPYALTSVQNLNQWVADLTLYLLASLPVQVHNHYRFPGGSLINDVKTVNLLRELLVVIRIWGLISEFCLPVFTRVSGDDRQLDVVAHLFKLLTKRIQSIGGEPDELLLDECCLLPNQVLITQVDFNLKSRGIASPCLYSSLTPFNCIYFTDPTFLKYNIKTHTIDGAVICNSSKRMDVIRHVSLGPVHLDTYSASKVRLCTRCYAMSLIPNLPNHRQQPTSRSWEQRFSKSCPCGGYWS